jgi:hypothetical protein
MAMKLRKDDDIFLIGTISPKIDGPKLPSIGQVLSRLFFCMREEKLSVKESASKILEEVFEFWERARIPIRSKVRCVEKIEKLYKDWRCLQIKKKRMSKHEIELRETFANNLNNLFDIAAQNALQIIKIEEDREFLIAQRKPGREGCMLGVDTKLSQKETRRKEWLQKNEDRKKKYLEEQESSSE